MAEDYLLSTADYELTPIHLGLVFTVSKPDFAVIAASQPQHHPELILITKGSDRQWFIQIMRQRDLEDLPSMPWNVPVSQKAEQNATAALVEKILKDKLTSKHEVADLRGLDLSHLTYKALTLQEQTLKGLICGGPTCNALIYVGRTSIMQTFGEQISRTLCW